MSEIERHRGDTKPIIFKLWEDKAAGKALNITSFTFRFTVNSEKAPLNTDNELFTLAGSIDGSPTDGRVKFTPTAVNMDLPPKSYFFDFEVTDADGYISTEMLDKFKITQDISK